MYIELLAAKNVADAKRLRILYDLAEDARVRGLERDAVPEAERGRRERW